MELKSHDDSLCAPVDRREAAPEPVEQTTISTAGVCKHFGTSLERQLRCARLVPAADHPEEKPIPHDAFELSLEVMTSYGSKWGLHFCISIYPVQLANLHLQTPIVTFSRVSYVAKFCLMRLAANVLFNKETALQSCKSNCRLQTISALRGLLVIQST